MASERKERRHVKSQNIKLQREQQNILKVIKQLEELQKHVKETSNALQVEELQMKASLSVTMKYSGPLTANVDRSPALAQPAHAEAERSAAEVNRTELSLGLLKSNIDEEEEEDSD